MKAGGKEENLDPGLYLVATPIGNLEDITLRALRVLKQADVVACEDTRQTQKLLNHFNISARTVSYHEHNEITQSAELVIELEQGARVALVTDAGTPGVSDPGYRLVSLAIRHHIPVIPIPGAAAFLSALIASGLAADSFQFNGFLPAKSGQRKQALEAIQSSPRTEIFYEAPTRIRETVEDIVAILGDDRHIVVARELTKIHEEFLRGTSGQVLAALNDRELKGEITLLIGKLESTAQPRHSANVSQRVKQAMHEEGIDEKTALKKVARDMGIGKSEAYREWQRTKT
jgi:16S rRNA (cytidine1402-2'-O)-methyltransferase